VVGRPGPGVLAQEATPEPDRPAGLLGRLDSEVAPGQALSLVRVVIPVGGSVAPHTHPGETVWHLESGAVGFTLLDGEARLVRAVAGAPAAATPTAAEEAIPVGAELTLGAGDTVYYDGSALQRERNLGDGAAVVLVASLRGVDAPLRQMAEGAAAATPAP
jgi:hypothetical protein